MAILIDHHIIPRQFKDHLAFRDIDSRMFNIEIPGNRIYLPGDIQLGADMGLSPHPGGHLSTYYDAIQGALDKIEEIESPNVRAAEIKALIYAMRVGFANGDLYTNLPKHKTREELDSAIQKVFADYRGYLAAYPNELQAILDIEQKGLDSGQNHLIQWSAILGNARREKLLTEAIARNPGVNLTAKNRNLGGTPWNTRFEAVDPLPYLYPTPGLAPAHPGDFQPLPGLVPPSLDGLNQTEGFTPSNPLLTYGAPGFPTPDPSWQRLWQLPPSTAAPRDPLVLQFNAETGRPLTFFSDGSPVTGPAPSDRLTPYDQGALYGTAALGAALAAPELLPLLPQLWPRLGAAIGGTAAASAPAFANAASGRGSAGGGVFSTGAAPYNAFNNDYTSFPINSGGYDPGLASSLPPTEHKSLDQEPDHANSYSDRFGSWAETSAGTMPAQTSGVVGDAGPDSAGAVRSEDVRRLTRVNSSNAVNAFASGSAPVPYVSPPEFDDRFGAWSIPSADRQSLQASRPIGAFADEPSYTIPPPIWGLEDRGSTQRSDAEEWFSRWIRPYLRQE